MAVDIEKIANQFEDFTGNMIVKAFEQTCRGVKNDVFIQGVNNVSKKPDKIQSTS